MALQNTKQNMTLQTLILAACAAVASAHSGHQNANPVPEVPADANWMTKHMAEEHHLDSWDNGAFFALHDYNSDNVWSGEEILRTYGLFDKSNKHVTSERRNELLGKLLDLMDDDGDGYISHDEWMDFVGKGETLPDLGVGPGHHGDDEYEYEIHHWEKYHDENTRLEDLTHPEDIEHFKKHEEEDRAQENLERLESMEIVEDNIPLKFRRHKPQ